MSTPKVVFGAAAADPQKIQRVVIALVKFAKGVALFTPTDIDDKVIAFLETFVNEQWFLELLQTLMELNDKGDLPKAAQMLKERFQVG